MIVFTPMDFNAAILAREGTEEGVMECLVPCLAMKATWEPVGNEKMEMLELGCPQGVSGLTSLMWVRLLRW